MIMTFIIGVAIGWLTPRPVVFAKLEQAIWTKLKTKIPSELQWWH